MRAYTEDLKNKASEVRYYFDNEVAIFFDMYKPYLGEISQEEIKDIKPALVGIFRESKTRANEKVKNAVEEYLKNQTKAKLFNLWNNITDFLNTPYKLRSENKHISFGKGKTIFYLIRSISVV